MAVGDDATAAGYPLVPQTGPGGEFRNGWLEINRTRDFVARVKALIFDILPIEHGGTGGTTLKEAQTNLGLPGTISFGTADPAGGNPGDIYFKHVP